MNDPVSTRRRSPRGTALLRGTIVFDSGAMSLECVVRDLTTEGAKLVCSEHVTIPERFDLVVPRWKAPRACRIVWVDVGRCGVEFVADDPMPADKESEIDYLRAECASLTLEVFRLRRRLGEMDSPSAQR